MTIKIYPGQMPSAPVEEHPWVGTIGAWFDAAGIDYADQAVQPVTVRLNGALVDPTDWAITMVAASDTVAIHPIPRGGIGSFIHKTMRWDPLTRWVLDSMTPKTPSDPGQGAKLQSFEATGNTAKRNQVVPELYGKMLRYPDYLTPSRRHFAGPRTQLLEMLMCVGPGRYEIDPGSIKIGNTPISSMEGAEFAVHQPGDDLSGIVQHENWYRCPEVGGTSAGTAGLDLVATDSGAVNPTASQYALNGGSISADVPYPDSWGGGTVMSLIFDQEVTVARVQQGERFINTFTSDWREIAPFVGLRLVGRGNIDGSLRVASVSADGNTITLERLVQGGEGFDLYRDLPAGVRMFGVCRTGRTYAIQSSAGVAVTVAPNGGGAWAGFAPRTVPASRASWTVQADTVFGERAGPFVACPPAEKARVIEVDVFFPRGLAYVDGNGSVNSRTVGVEYRYRDAATGSAWQSITRWYTAATLDQIGYTERLTLPSAIRPEVAMRRRGARSASTQVYDVVEWYAMRTQLPTRTSYPGWTTLSVRVKGLGQIAANSENQVNLVATRMLPELQADGSWSPPRPTRDVSAAVMHICSSIGYTAENLDMDELQRLHALWRARGETFDSVLDEMTVQEAIKQAFGAGMAEMTIDNGAIKPVRDGLRDYFEQGYSAQNTTPGGIVRSFIAPRADDNDGVEVEFQDESDGWATKTVKCMLPGSLGLRLEKLKLQGVTNRARAWRIGMRRARALRYQRWTYTWGTELDALNSNYGDGARLVCDQSAILQQVSEADGQARLHVTEPLRWMAGEQHVVSFRRPDGSVSGPWPATRGGDDYELLAPIPRDQWPAVTLKHEPPHVYFGPADDWSYPAIVRSVKPGSGDSVSVTAVSYDARIFADDDSSPPAE